MLRSVPGLQWVPVGLVFLSQAQGSILSEPNCFSLGLPPPTAWVWSCLGPLFWSRTWARGLLAAGLRLPEALDATLQVLLRPVCATLRRFPGPGLLSGSPGPLPSGKGGEHGLLRACYFVSA